MKINCNARNACVISQIDWCGNAKQLMCEWSFYSLLNVFLKLWRRFGFSTRSLGHVMFSFTGTAQEAGAGFPEQFPRRKTSIWILDPITLFPNQCVVLYIIVASHWHFLPLTKIYVHSSTNYWHICRTSKCIIYSIVTDIAYRNVHSSTNFSHVCRTSNVRIYSIVQGIG